MLLTLILEYAAIGIVAGFFAGLLGVGGGVIVVPALVWVFRWQGMSEPYLMRLAAATSLGAMIISCFVSVTTHRRRGAKIGEVLPRLVLPVIIGTVLGTCLASILKTSFLEVLFGCMLLVVGLLMFFNIQPTGERKLPGRLGMSGIGLAIGANSGLFGLGGGIITIPILSYFNVPLRNAVGVSAALAIIVAIVGTVSYIISGWQVEGLPTNTLGYVYWPGVLGISITSPICAILGARLAHRLPVIILRRIFALFLCVVGIQMFFNS